jgi:flagellar protein FlgJ
MLEAIDASLAGGIALTALGDGGRDKARERAEALRNGRMVDDPKKLDAKIRGVAEDFVSVFMSQVMKSMRSTVRENPAMHGDNGEKFFQGMLDDEQAKTLAKGDGYGLTELIYQSLLANNRLALASSAGAAEAEEAAP